MKIREFRKQYPQYDDIPDQELATKLHAKSYSDMPFEDFAQRFGVTAEAAPKASGPSKALGAAREAIQGATFEFGDEIGLGAAALAAKGAQKVGLAPDTGESIGEIYRDMRGAYGAEREQFREENPGTAVAANLAGALGTGGAGAVRGMTALAPRIGTMGAAATVGGAQAGAYGAGAAEPGERIEGAAKAAPVGAVLAPVATAGANALASTLANRGAERWVSRLLPNRDQVRQAAQRSFAEADNLGVQLAPAKVQQIQGSLNSLAKTEGFNPRIHPKVAAALDSFDDLAADVPTLGRMEQQRRILGAAAKSMEADERRIAVQLIDELDDAIGGLKAADVVTGNAAQAGETMQRARGLWARQAKLGVIEDAMERAANQASGFENGIRIQFRSILNNPKKLRGFSEAEREAMQRIVRGGKVENILKFLGRFGPGEGAATNLVGSSIGAGAGAAVGGPVGAAAVPIAGYAARKGAQAATRGNVEKLRQLVAAGGANPRQIVQRYTSQAGAAATPQDLAKIMVSSGQTDLIRLSSQLNALSGPQRRLANEALALMAAGQAGAGVGAAAATENAD